MVGAPAASAPSDEIEVDGDGGSKSMSLPEYWRKKNFESDR